MRLELLERRPNDEVRAALQRADILAEQFLAAYAMLAVEGLASGTPVMAHVSFLPPELRDHPAVRECPIVDTSVETLTDHLRLLVTDPDLRMRPGPREPRVRHQATLLRRVGPDLGGHRRGGLARRASAAGALGRGGNGEGSGMSTGRGLAV